MIEAFEGVGRRQVRNFARLTQGQLGELAGVDVQDVQVFEWPNKNRSVVEEGELQAETETLTLDPETQAKIEDALRGELAWDRLRAKYAGEPEVPQLDASIRDGEMSGSEAARRLYDWTQGPWT